MKKTKKHGRKKATDSSKIQQITADDILEVMTQAGRPLYVREILTHLDIPSEQRRLARYLIKELVNEGRLVHLKGNRYGLPRLMRLVTGTLITHPDGFGFVHPDDPDQKDVFIPARSLKGAVHGDKVVARIEAVRARGPEGSIIRIIDRAIKKVVGTFYKRRNVSRVIPEDERLLFEVLIPKKYTKKAKKGQIVVAKVMEFPEGARNPEGRVVEVLGDPDEIGVQTKIVIHKYDLPHVFPHDVDSEAASLPDRVIKSDLKGRKDLTDLPLVTIDGEDARDFDDAVHVKKTRGGYVLTVAIADVSHYVHPESAIDREAYCRGTSVYFPNQVLPMLPEALSNHLCSLVPDRDRLALVARITFDKKARVKTTSFFKAVIKSHRRFTYSEVRKILEESDKKLIEENKELMPYLIWMKELALLLFERRKRRGSIDFDLPEPRVILGLTGELEQIVRRERNIAHHIIEEFMIAANEAVAASLSKRQIPTLYRIHGAPAPEKVREFVEFVQGLGLEIEFPDEVSPRWCQKVIEMVEGRPQEYVVNTVLLRTMQQAVYSPENTGHFGLASPTYLHFTSPIRRYPDLVVHRILKGNLRRTRKRPIYEFEQLDQIAAQSSARERIAMEAEREMLDRLKVRFMAEKVGQIFDGVISAVTSFGFFVELQEVFIEGAVRLVDMVDDYYQVDLNKHRLIGRRTGKTFQIGQPVKVRVKAVNISRRHVNLEVVE